LIELFNEVDLVITAGGQTLYELARIGLPAIAIKVAENQNLNILGWEKTGFLQFLGNWDKLSPELLCTAIEKSLSMDTRYAMQQAGLARIDGLGARRTIDIVIEKIRQKKHN